MSGLLAVGQVAQAQQCVPYARQISGVGLTGDAWRWWAAAEGRYERGNQPRPGAVLVFRQTPKMRYGHVAVVSRVVSKREIRIDHANWGTSRSDGKGAVRRDVAVLDVSPKNDWTQVRVWHAPSDSYGARINPTYGFIYARGGATHPATAHEHPATKPVQAAALRGPAKPEKPAASVAPEKVAVPAVPEKAITAPRGADDLNRQVLARLRGQQTEPTAAAKPAKQPVPAAAPTATKATKASKVSKAPTVTKARVIMGKRSVDTLVHRDGKKQRASKR